MTCLVTGANGFVGAAVVRALLGAGKQVRALVRAGSDARNLQDLELETVAGDITDPHSLEEACDGCRFVFHVAADYRLWVPRPEGMLKTNVEGSVNVIESAARARVEKLVYTSSVAVLGIRADRRPADEATPVSFEDMVGPYKQSKFLAERAVQARARELKLPITVVNPSTPIGPGDLRPTPTGRIIVDGARGRIPAYVDTGLNVVHVDDVARGHLLALESGRLGERYILGGEDLSLERILGLVAKHSGQRAPRVRLARSLLYPVAFGGEWLARLTGGEPLVTLDELRMSKKHMYFSSKKAATELGYEWRDPEQAIIDALDWFRRRGYLGD